jgi:hypothetical protein
MCCLAHFSPARVIRALSAFRAVVAHAIGGASGRVNGVHACLGRWTITAAGWWVARPELARRVSSACRTRGWARAMDTGMTVRLRCGSARDEASSHVFLLVCTALLAHRFLPTSHMPLPPFTHYIYPLSYCVHIDIYSSALSTNVRVILLIICDHFGNCSAISLSRCLSTIERKLISSSSINSFSTSDCVL